MKKRAFGKLLAVFLTVAMLATLALPFSALTASAAAPSSYTSITAGSSVRVNISSAGMVKYYRFVPTVTGYYTFSSSNYSGDPYASLLDASGNTLMSNDDGAGARNFSISYHCNAGTVYYVAARQLSSSVTGSFTLNIFSLTPDFVETEDGTESYTLFRSGNASSTGNSSNINPSSLTNGGYDIYVAAPNTSRIGASIRINHEVTQRVTLSIRAFDVDESSGERDIIYLVDETAGTRTRLDGYLSGRDWEWNTTTFYLDPSLFTVDHTYHFELHESVSGWLVYVREVNLLIPDPIPVEPKAYSFTATATASGRINTTLYLQSNAASLPLTLEYSAKHNGDQLGSAFSSVTATSAGVSKALSFQLEPNSPDGVYRIEVTLKKADGTVVATFFYNVSLGGSVAVSYDPNGGSSNIPLDDTTYRPGNTVTALFNYIPVKEDHSFLGWARSASATEPEFTVDGTKSFTIGSSSVTLYAVWRQNVHYHTESAWIVETEPTCAVAGLRYTRCTECLARLNEEEIPATGIHTPGAFIVETEPTCVTEGLRYNECTVCNVRLDEEAIPATGVHVQGAWDVYIPVSCMADGYRRASCVHCGIEMADERIPTEPHTAGAWIVDVEPDCFSGGTRHTVCIYCGEVMQREALSAVGHIESEWIETSKPTCTADGYKYTECIKCGVRLDQGFTPAFGHDESDWIIGQAPTAMATGHRYKTCSNCQEVVVREIMPVLSVLEVDDILCKSGSEVEVNINIQNNPGIIGAVLALTYDPDLTLIDAKAGGAWSTLSLTKPGALESGCRFVWDGVNADDANNGTIITLTFAVPVGVAVDTVYDIEVSYSAGEVINLAGDSLDIVLDAGSITVDEIVGDVNDDGIVNVADAIILRRYLSSGYTVTINESQADANGDGEITIADVVEIRKFIINR